MGAWFIITTGFRARYNTMGRLAGATVLMCVPLAVLVYEPDVLVQARALPKYVFSDV